jgi:hypothetical protein
VVAGSPTGAKRVPELVPPGARSSVDRRPRAGEGEARLLVSGPDAVGIVASFSQLLFASGCGIFDCTSESSEADDRGEDATHHGGGRMFFQRIVFDCSELNIERSALAGGIDSTCQKFGMECRLVSLVPLRRKYLFGYFSLNSNPHCRRITFNSTPVMGRREI